MIYRGYGILECKVLCETTELVELGIPNDLWLPFVFDLNEIKSMKLAVDPDKDESSQQGCAQIFFKGSPDYVIVDIPYEEMTHLWMAFKMGLLNKNDRYVDLAKKVADLHALENQE